MVDVGAQATAEIMKHVPCPHCGAQARLEPHAELRWVCAVCGGPRVPVEHEAAHSDRERAELIRANRAKRMAFAYRLFGIGLSLTGTLLAALGTALAAVSTPIGIAMVLFAAAFIVAGITYVRRAKKQNEEAKLATFSAWESVAEALLSARGGDVTGEQIAREMHTSLEDVERMMSFLAVDDRVRIVVKDAELVYSSGKIRIGEDGEALTSAVAKGEALTSAVVKGEAPITQESEEEDDAPAADTPGADARRR